MVKVPGLISAEFYNKDYDDHSSTYTGKHSYMIGISGQHAILFGMRDTGPIIKCDM